MGYLWSLDKKLVQDIIAMKTHTSMNTNILRQEMAFESTKVPRKFIDDQLIIWKERRDLLYVGLKDAGLELWNPEGAFYMLPKIDNAADFVWDMFTKFKVITYLGDWFGAEGHVRFSYALDTVNIEDGLDRIGAYIRSK